MRKILNTGVVSIVAYNHAFPLIIRNRGIFDSEYVVCDDIDKINPCILHTENGCMLPDVYRASEGLLYLSIDDYHEVLYSQEDMIHEYYNQRESLRALYNEYKGVKIPKKSVTEERVKEFIKCLINK